MDPATRKKMGDQAVALARSCDYHTTGTVEFLMDKNKDFYFLEMNTRLQVEHPITEEITGVDLVEQQILISAGHKLQYKQDDIKINGHSVEYRVYAEDPSRKFLPSIGFLKKYLEPKPHEHIRIDTGVQEGSEISMYYDPMISKLITWGKDRKEALDLIDKAFDEYVVQGVAHNIGFGKSIVANEAFAKGDYSTAFIPDFYPEGYRGETLTNSHMEVLALACHRLKNDALSLLKDASERNKTQEHVVYVTVVGQGEEPDRDWRVELAGDSYTVTDVESGKSTTHRVNSYAFEHNSLIKLNIENRGNETFQLTGQKNELRFDFYYKGGKVETLAYDESQYKYKKHMAPPVKIDHSRSILSPMPGLMITVDVEAGQTVVDGQQLCTIEAMKMQNIIKAERDGKIKSVNVKAGDSVAVDELLIEFE